MAMKKARKGKRGCLTRAGKLKKGFRWAKRRKGFCISTTKKKAAKRRKVGSKKKATARRRRSVPPMSAELRAAILSVPSAEKRYESRAAFTPEELKSFGALRRRR